MIDIGILISIRYQYHFDQNIVIIDEWRLISTHIANILR